MSVRLSHSSLNTSSTLLECAELLDTGYMDALSSYKGASRKWPVKDTVFFKLQGTSSDSLSGTAAFVREIALKHGATDLVLAADDKEAEGLWADRKNALHVALATFPGSRPWATDVW